MPVNTNLVQFLMSSIEKNSHKVYLQFEEQRITYGELSNRIGKAAAGLYELGVRQHDKVCIMLHNSPEYLDVWFALSFLGAVAVPLNVHLKGEGLQYIINHSDCKLLIADDDFLSNILPCLSSIQRDITLVVHGNQEGNHERVQLQEVLNNNIMYTPTDTISPTSINSILYTSGTTGLPKGVMLSHTGYIHSAQAFADDMIRARPDDVLFTMLPLFHINAQAHTVLGAIHAGATIALSKRFSASRFWDEIRDHEATIFNSLGSMIPILCKQPEKENDSQNPTRLTACAATPKEFWQQFEQRFGVQIVEGYGLTETTGFCVANPLHKNRPPSIGVSYPYVETKIIDDKGEELPVGEVGEIIMCSLKPNTFMEGYYKMPDQTEEATRNGWFHTGDRGYQDKDGYVYFCDRMKQCIRRRGENISSWEIEKVVDQHPKVLESAAVGVPSEIGEEDVKLYVVLKQDEVMAHEEVLDWCQEHMAYFMVPRYVEFIDEFPKTATERIQKFKLKEVGINNAWDREKEGYIINK
ncbi:ATP-dependent acyl-CoA ligase [Microbacteriaceae bacterium 4G12]